MNYFEAVFADFLKELCSVGKTTELVSVNNTPCDPSEPAVIIGNRRFVIRPIRKLVDLSLIRSDVLVYATEPNGGTCILRKSEVSEAWRITGIVGGVFYERGTQTIWDHEALSSVSTVLSGADSLVAYKGLRNGYVFP